jgi:hypothetical protein
VLFLQHRALARRRRLVDQIGGKVLFGLMYQSRVVRRAPVWGTD